MAETEDIFVVPGLALQALLRTAKIAALRKLIGSQVVELLEGLNPELLSEDRFGNLAASLIDPSEALRNPEQRDQIINLLPLPKARELAKRLGVQEGRDVHSNL